MMSGDWMYSATICASAPTDAPEGSSNAARPLAPPLVSAPRTAKRASAMYMGEAHRPKYSKDNKVGSSTAINTVFMAGESREFILPSAIEAGREARAK